MKAVQKRTLVQVGRAFEIATLQGGPEVGDIARDCLRIELELGRAEEESVSSKVVSECVERLGQAMAGTVGGYFRPEAGQELVAASGPVGCCQQCKEGEALALGARSDRAPTALEPETSEGAEAERRRWLTDF